MAIGTDFERFLQKGEQVLSAEFLGLPDKFEPHVELFDEAGGAGHIHRDNVMVEMCVCPQETGHGLVLAVSRVLCAAEMWLAQTAPGVVIGPLAAAELDAESLSTRAGRELGCDIDFIAQDMDSVNREPLNTKLLGRSRFAGGHLHFSWPRQGIPAWVGAGLCDLLIGLPEAVHLNPNRAAFYGVGSLHRPTQYPDGTRGVEYRPLDCYWTTTREHLERVAKRAEAVHKVLSEGTVDFIRRLLGKWEPLNSPRNTLVELWRVPEHRDTAAWVAEEFRKEFGYDPV